MVLYKEPPFLMLSAMADHPSTERFVATKCVSLKYSAPDAILSLFEEFRLMCNDAIRIAAEEKPISKFKLIQLAYPILKEYGLHSHYTLSACEVAFAVCKNRRTGRVPQVRRIFLKLDNQSYRLDHLLLRIPSRPRNFIFLVLQGSEYHTSLIDDTSLRRGSVTITPESVNLALSKDVEPIEPIGFVGVDANEKNATISATDGWHKRFEELGEVAAIKDTYREIRARIGQIATRDRRIARHLLAKYSRRERNRTKSRLNKVTSKIVDYSREHDLGIKMENLKGIRKLYRRGNGQSRSFRGRMNTWVFGETQRQIDYKARWDGVPVWYVNPRGTSRNCPDCGSRVVPMVDRELYCPKCDKNWDRDDLASKNIMACVVPKARPSMRSCDRVRGGDGSSPLSGGKEG